jgi:hypothetical protein
MSEGLRHLARIATGSTAIGALTSAFTAVPVENGCQRITINVDIDAASTIFLRKNGTNILLNEGVPLAPATAYNFQYDVVGGDTITIQFGTAMNIIDLVIKQE